VDLKYVWLLIKSLIHWGRWLKTFIPDIYAPLLNFVKLASGRLSYCYSLFHIHVFHYLQQTGVYYWQCTRLMNICTGNIKSLFPISWIAIHCIRFMHYAQFITRPDTTNYSHAYPWYAAYRFATRRPTIKFPPEFVSLQNTLKNSSSHIGDILRAC
jgi:hypothetical protein